MYVIKRTKSLPPAPMDAITGAAPPAVHWATSVGPLGDVTGWTPDRVAATAFDQQTAQKTLAFYAGRPAAGRFATEETVAEEPANPAPLSASEEDVRAMLAEIERQRQEIARLQRELDEATAPTTAPTPAPVPGLVELPGTETAEQPAASEPATTTAPRPEPRKPRR